MNMFADIEYDHEKIKTLIYDIIALGDGDAELRQPLFDKMKKELLILHRAEEKTLYAVLDQQKSTHDIVENLQAENETIETLLDKLTHLDDNKETWQANFEKLQSIVFRHFDKEEEKLFSKTEKILEPEQIEQIAERLHETKTSMWKTRLIMHPISLMSAFFKKVHEKP